MEAEGYHTESRNTLKLLDTDITWPFFIPGRQSLVYSLMGPTANIVHQSLLPDGCGLGVK